MPFFDSNAIIHHARFRRHCRLLAAVLLAEVLGRGDHVVERCLGLLPLAGFEAAVGVDPELVGLEVLQHLLNAVFDLLFGRYPRAVDVVDT